MHKKHFFLSNNIAEAHDFSPQNQGFGGHSLPTRDRVVHAQMVKGQYETAVNQAIARLEERENQGQPVANGIYVDLKMDKSFIPNSLGKQDSPKGATIMKVTDNGDENDVDVTVYVKKDKKDWLKNKVDDYSSKNTAKGKPCNESVSPFSKLLCSKHVFMLLHFHRKIQRQFYVPAASRRQREKTAYPSSAPTQFSKISSTSNAPNAVKS